MNLPDNSFPQRVNYQPSPAQVERAKALRRFNRLALYLPVGLVAALIVLITIFLLYFALFEADSQAIITLSAVADSIIIIYAIPTMLLCGLFPTLFIIAFAQGRQRGMAPIQTTRRILWQIESQLIRVQGKINEVAPKVTGPLISLHSRFAFLCTFITRLRQLFLRS